jgi:hypothetical protein
MAREDEEKLLLLLLMGFIVTSPCLTISKMNCLRSLEPLQKLFKMIFVVLFEVYVDGIVVKTRQRSSILLDLARVFDRLHSTRMMFNYEKCVFGVSGGKFLGFLGLYRGIEANK